MPVTFENTRFDPDLIEFHGIAKQMAASVGYTADLSVDGRLAQLLRLRVAQMKYGQAGIRLAGHQDYLG